MISLVGREAEQAELGRLVESARNGLSGVLVVRGDAGIGKTCLLDAVASSAADFDVLRLVGIESEMRLGFAALHQLLTPFLDGLDSLPSPQARALKAAFGISDDVAPDPFLVGLAALTLITTAATRRQLLIMVDDTQWLDQESADALGFLGRRLYADRVCLLVSMRDSADDRHLFDGLLSLTLAPLSEAESVALLDAAVQGPLADHVRARLLAEARGNPLALVEFSRELSSDQLAGAAQLPEPLAVDRRLERSFLWQVGALPPATQRLLLVAAAEPTGEVALIFRAGRDLDFDQNAITAAQAAGLVELGPQLAFRHPLIRSAVYQGASHADRCRAHEALAVASDAERDPDRSAWHRGAAAQLPDDEVATELERAAHRAGSRGSCAASAALLARAAQLTLDTGQRAIRLLGAAAADLTAGSSVRAQANLARALPDLHDPVLLARARQLEAAIAFIDSFPGTRPSTTPGRAGEIVSMMLDAARALEPLDVHLARDAVLDTIPMAIYFGDSSAVSAVEVAQVARSFKLPTGTASRGADLLLDAIAELLAEGYRSAAPLLRDALAAVQTDSEIRSVPRHMAKACWIAFALSDDDALGALADACASTSREQGAFQVLPEALNYQGLRELRVGSLNVADDIFTENIEMHTMLRRQSGPGEAAKLILSAWRGRETEVRTEAAELSAEARQLGLVVGYTEYALLLLELGLGNYHAASSLAREHWNEDLALGGFGPPTPSRRTFAAATTQPRRPRSRTWPNVPLPTRAFSTSDSWRGAKPCSRPTPMPRRTSANRSSSWKQAVRGCTSHARSCSTANGSGGRSGAATPASTSGQRATPSSQWARTASPTGPESSCSQPARVPAGASTRRATTSRRRSHGSHDSQPAARPTQRSRRASSSVPTLSTTTSERCIGSSTSSRGTSSGASCRSTDRHRLRGRGIRADAGVAHSRRVATDDPNGVVTLRGEGGVDQLLRRAVARIEGLGLEVLAVIDHSGEAAEAGLSMPDAKLVLFGSPEAATRLMVAHPRIALDLPLKLLISEGNDGHVFVGYNAPGYLAHRHGVTDDEADALRVVETIALATRSTP